MGSSIPTARDDGPSERWRAMDMDNDAASIKFLTLVLLQGLSCIQVLSNFHAPAH